MDARANFGYSLVAYAPSPADSGTELDVESADDFPAVPFNATVWPAGEIPLNSNAEIVRVTAIVGDTLTIEREQEGTDAKAIAVGYQFAATVTAKAFTDIESQKAGVNGAITGGTITVNSAGVSIDLPAYLTTAQAPGPYLTTAALSGDTTKYAGVGETVTTVAGTDLGLTVNTNGVSIAHPAWLTTAQAPGGYLTTAALSGDTTKYAGIGESVGTLAGTDLALTVNTAGVSIEYPKWITTYANDLTSLRAGVGETVGTIAGTDLAMTVDTDGVSIGYPKWITTYANDLTSLRAGVGETVGTVAGTDLSMTVNTDGVSIGYPKWITTYANDLTSLRAGVGETVGTIAGTDLAMTVNTDGVSVGYAKWITTAALSGDTTKYAGVGETVGTVAGTDVAITMNTDGLSLAYPKYITTAALSDHSHGNPTLALTNLSGTTASASNGLTLSLSAAAAAAGTYSGHFIPYVLRDGTTNTSLSLSQLGLQPFTIHNNLSFGQVDFIGSATIVPTSAGNTWSARLTNSSQGNSYSAVYSITNANMVDLYLFSRGSGVFSSELETFASTRNSFITHYRATMGANATLTNTAGGSVKISQTVSMSVSYPMVTSSTATSINPASSYTAWGTGYTTWTSTASNSTVDTISTSAGKSVSVASTYPATAGWSSWKMVPLNFARSLTPGEYWLGMVRYSSTDSSSTFGSSGTGALGTGNSYSVSYNASGSTQTAQISWVGNTNTIVSSLGFLGFASQASMAHLPGLGTFTGTYSGTATYLNNMGNPAGAIAFSQINTAVSMFQSWFMMDSNLP